MSIVKHAVIAAAGLGSRLGMGKPKCLIEIDGTTILEHQLGLLKKVEDVRIVVGFEEAKVIELAKNIRSDITIVRNPAYRSTTTLHSYALGANYIQEKMLFLDGDILFQPTSFNNFLESCNKTDAMIGVTETKTKDAVFVRLEERYVKGFSRIEAQPYEWANLSWLLPSMLDTMDQIAVFERLMQFLPLKYKNITCYEIDTVEDLNNTKTHLDIIRENR